MKSWLNLILLILTPTLAWASDDSCLRQTQKALIQNRPVAIAVAERMGLSTEQIHNLPVQSEHFSGVVNKASIMGVSSLHYDVTFRSTTHVLELSYEINPAEDFSDNLFSVEYSWTLFTKEGLPVVEQTAEYSVKDKCAFKIVGESFIEYKPLGANRIAVHKVENAQGKPPIDVTKNFQKERVMSGALLSQIDGLDQLRASKHFNARPFFTLITDGDLVVVEVQLSAVPSIVKNSPFTSKDTKLNGLEVKINALDMALRFFESDDHSYRVQEQIYDGGSKITETVPREAWLALSLVAEGSLPKPVGFVNSDFEAQIVKFRVSGKGDPKLFNSGMYSQNVHLEKSGDDYKLDFNLVTFPLPESLLWNTNVTAEEERYLADSKFIQLDKVRRIADEIRPRLSGLNRLQASKIIIEAMGKFMTADLSSFSDGTIEQRTVEDILRTGKGVCQHYAVLFISIARALGIPSRMVYGFSINENLIGGHAWVEVKVNRNTWWPLEPQDTSDHLLRRSYLPLAETRSYEAEANDPEGRLKIQLREDKIWKPFLGSTFTKRD